MAALLLTLALAALGAKGAWGQVCAFPPGGCHPTVCAKHNLVAYSSLLDKSAFWANSSGTVADFSRVPAGLGFYFGKYTTKFNGGKYDSTLKANNGAPSLNYFELRSSLGKLNRTGVSLAQCCSNCATATGCTLWLFNPYLNTVKDSAGVVVSRTFKATGDCYFLLASERGKTWTREKVDALCSSSTASLVDSSVKPYFYSGTCNSQISDDPHFVGAHGTRYDFNGELDKSFCLLADQRLQLNAVLRGYLAPGAPASHAMRSWMKELGVVWVDAQGQRHALRLVARKGKEQARGAGFLAAAELDGAALAVPGEAGASVTRGDMKLAYEGVSRLGPYEVENFQLTVGQQLDLHLALRVAHPKLQTPQDAEVHFNLVFDNLQVTEHIHGVLGQTYRETEAQRMKAIKYTALSQILGAPIQADGKTGQGFLEGEVADYETSSVVSADCKFSSISE